ncbi:MAG: hypothetical protein O7G85_02965 [Planctomycetota bacterium]|nr:hypothetical protein [Planctomycetota bacterium]
MVRKGYNPDQRARQLNHEPERLKLRQDLRIAQKRKIFGCLLLLSVALASGCAKSRSHDWAQLSPLIKPTIMTPPPVIQQQARSESLEPIQFDDLDQSSMH